MGLHGLEWSGNAYRGLEEDGCKAVCGNSEPPHSPKYGGFGNSWRRPFFSKIMIPNTLPNWPKLGSRIMKSIHL